MPLPVRHASRLLVFERNTQSITHAHFSDIGEFLRIGDHLVINKTRVIPGRLIGSKESGGKAEILLLKRIDESHWEALVGGKRIGKGKLIYFPEGITAKISGELEGSRRLVEFNQPIDKMLDKIGEMPLPPYIHEHLNDPERYQTVFAKQSGSAAAPTAGLHFTNEIISTLKQRGIDFSEITLHVGLDTFAPVTEDEVEDHKIHSEWREVDAVAAERINLTKQKGNRVIAVGTTSVRTIESAATHHKVKVVSGPTSLYIYPGYHFKVVDGMITNFHLPQSTLLMLVSAFMGKENAFRCYAEAIEKRYRFYSFGDAMLIL